MCNRYWWKHSSSSFLDQSSLELFKTAPKSADSKLKFQYNLNTYIFHWYWKVYYDAISVWVHNFSVTSESSKPHYQLSANITAVKLYEKHKILLLKVLLVCIKAVFHVFCHAICNKTSLWNFLTVNWQIHVWCWYKLINEI